MPETREKRAFPVETSRVTGAPEGSGIETACRTMILAGLDWLDEEEGDKKHRPTMIHRFAVLDGTPYGRTIEAEALIARLREAAPGVDGSVLIEALSHIQWATLRGWESYTTAIRERAQ